MASLFGIKPFCSFVFSHFCLIQRINDTEVDQKKTLANVPVYIFGFCKDLIGNVWQRLKNDGYKNHLQ